MIAQTLRRYIRAVSCMAIVFLVSVGAAQAAAPQIRTQAPGYFRLILGAYEITALSDGTKFVPWDTLTNNVPPSEIARLEKRSKAVEPIESSSAAYLVNTGRSLILVDTGSGQMWDESLGKVVTNLKLSGYSPDQVDMVLITHLHFDHAGGLVFQGRAVFPNATVWLNKREADFWLNKANRDKAPEAMRPWFDKAMAAVAPYLSSGRLRTFTDSRVFAPGVTAIETPGHTPGDTSYSVESDHQKLVIWGDLIHFSAVQFTHPEAGIAFDVDEKGNATQRVAALADAASKGYLTASSHISFPGIGYVVPEDDHYAFVPVNYTTLISPPKTATP